MLSKIYYTNSRTLFLFAKLWSKIKNYYRSSVLYKITELDERKTYTALGESGFIEIIKVSSKRLREGIGPYFASSRIISSVGNSIKQDDCFSVKPLAIIILAALSVNTVLYCFLKIKLDLYGWLIRGVIFLSGILGLFIRSGWQDISKTSVILKRLNNSCQNKNKD